MKRNMGTVDRVLRTVVAAPVLLVLGLAVFDVGSALSVVALALAGVMLATSAAATCPLYTLLGISTCPRRPTPPDRARMAAQH